MIGGIFVIRRKLLKWFSNCKSHTRRVIHDMHECEILTSKYDVNCRSNSTATVTASTLFTFLSRPDTRSKAVKRRPDIKCLHYRWINAREISGVQLRMHYYRDISLSSAFAPWCGAISHVEWNEWKGRIYNIMLRFSCEAYTKLGGNRRWQ